MKFSRRRLLGSMGLSLGMLPIFPQLRADAAAAFPKRLIVCIWPNGIERANFWPDGDGESFTLKPIMKPLEPWKKDLLVLGGLDLSSFMEMVTDPGPGNKVPHDGYGHDDAPAILTGKKLSYYFDFKELAGGDSIDQFIGAELAKRANLPFASLTVGARTDSGYNNTISYKGANSPGVTPENDPVRLWKTLFSGRSMPAATFDKLAAERKSVLDLVGGDLQAFAKRLGRDDRDRVNAHFDAIASIEKQLTAPATPGAACSFPAQPAAGLTAMERYPDLVKVQMDLIVAALRCDLTRTVTYTMTNTGGSGTVFSWLGAEFTGPGDEYKVREHHDIAHNEGRSAAHKARYVRVNQWYYEQIAYLVKQLAETPEGSGRMLDNTAVVVTNWSGQNHSCSGLPWVMIGNCGGYFKTGRLLKTGAWKGQGGNYWEKRGGTPHNGLLVALCNAMDVPVQTYGDPQWGGELAGVRG